MRRIHTIILNRRGPKQSRVPIVLLIAVVLLGINALQSRVTAGSIRTQSTVVLPTTAPVLVGMFQVVTYALGDQFDPHVDCNLVTYASDDLRGREEIRYFDFSTNLEHVVPGNGADSLSDVSGERIAF